MASYDTQLSPSPSALAAVSARLAAHYAILPLRRESDGTLVVAIGEPADIEMLDEISLVLGCSVRPVQAQPKAIREAIREHYGVGADTLERLVDGRDDLQVTDPSMNASIDEAVSDASIIKFVNELIVDAYNNRATDIHLEPYEKRLRIRYRIDGILFDARIPESIRHFREAIVSRIKIMASLDIAERRLPQDGRIRVRIGGKDFDLRVSVIPIAHGESVNIRILQRTNVFLGLEAVGFEPNLLARFSDLLDLNHGIILLTGPTGSGKTTTLYACLSKINESDRKIITIEDPVEYEIEGICQMHARPEIGLTFANGLRSMLRHDPDVMLVGEIRDFETAELAIRCALTGHLVFSTLHTNDAAGSIPRLIDIGVEPYLLASSIQAVLAQRLVRLICPHCTRSYKPDIELLSELGYDVNDTLEFCEGAGCDHCRQSGYYGRTAIHEMFVMKDEIRTLTVDRADGSRIKTAALESGMRTLRDDGLNKVERGMTTIEEILRVTQQDSE